MAGSFDDSLELPALIRSAEEAEISRSLYPGERALMIAVLEDAVRCYLGLVHYDRTNPEILARQAEYWLRVEDWESPFSFNNICELLGLEPQVTRQTILGWTAGKLEDLETRIRHLHTEASIGSRSL